MNTPLFHFFPLIYGAVLAVFSLILGFNGLYGQDAHECLWQSRAIFALWQGRPLPAVGMMGDVGIYPVLGALLRGLVNSLTLALQFVNGLAAATCLSLFVAVLSALSYGAKNKSRWAYALLGLAISPTFFRASLVSAADTTGLAFAMAAFYGALKSLDDARSQWGIGAIVFAVWAVYTRYELAAWTLPLVLFLWGTMFQRRQWGMALAAVAAGLLAALPYFWLKMETGTLPLGHPLLQEWSWWHFFQREFDTANELLHYPLPNVLYLFFPLAHPAFCLFLPGLFFLAKKTDWTLPTKMLLIASSGIYLLLLGGIPVQNLHYLLPMYLTLLWLLFPAWDRLYCYGFIFFPRITTGVLALVLTVQVLACAAWVTPVLKRNWLERSVARVLKEKVPIGATIYSFDLDVALRNYLPEIVFINLREHRWVPIPNGSFVLFNENLRIQWADKNPVLNFFDPMQEDGRMQWVENMGHGWQLWHRKD